MLIQSGCIFGQAENKNQHDFEYKNASLIGNDIGYISVSQIDMTSYKTILESVKQLKTNKMKALILDLRMIGGRDKDAAIKTADLFLDEGDNIGVIKIRNRNNKFKSSLIKAKSSKLTDVPIVVLIDMGTHAGAELVAMALKENKRALFVGVYTLFTDFF